MQCCSFDRARLSTCALALATATTIMACKDEADSNEAGTSSSTGTSATTVDPPMTSTVDPPQSTTTADETTDVADTSDSGTAPTSADESSSTGGDPIPVVIENPGFEANPLGPGGLNYMITPDGWDRYDPMMIIDNAYNVLGVLNPTGTGHYNSEAAPEGGNIAITFFFQEWSTGIPAGLSQTLGANLEANTQYTLSVEVGNIASPPVSDFDFTGFPGYRVELLAGSTLLVVDDNTLAPAEGEFVRSEISYTSGAADPEIGAPLEIRLINLNDPQNGIEVNFDDVRLDIMPAR